MPTIAHISDLHFGRERPAVVEGLLRSLAEAQPELILVSGDQTQRARRQEYRAAADFFQRLPCPSLLVPGNHDLPAFNLAERFLAPWRRWHQGLARQLEPETAGSDYQVVGINTARRWGAPFDWTRGRISSRQVVRLQQRLQTCTADQLRLLIAHHPFWLPPAVAHRQLVGGGKAALQLLRGELDVILSGHVHQAFVKVLQGVIISHAGSACSDRLAAGQTNSYNLLRGDRERLEVEQLSWSGRAFAPAARSWFLRGATGWTEPAERCDR